MFPKIRFKTKIRCCGIQSPIKNQAYVVHYLIGAAALQSVLFHTVLTAVKVDVVLARFVVKVAENLAEATASLSHLVQGHCRLHQAELSVIYP